ncbi:hypothetical protein FHW96_000252 [Novosphingobium sp. SG751A]|uniref:hypothetical protein n=1 Tax=Novosphingobium sp. SG751A TaxID=2587000 RepID=UPI001555A406|nr:hypothetical protein [Novosphingobium sp. SG751A]NOW44125.1 hypothetical protein [Novosphingobium sp. SG751A]
MPITTIWAAIKAFGIWQRIAAGLKWLFASPVRLCLILAITMAAVAYAEHRSAATWRQRTINVVAQLRRERAAATAAKLAYEAKSRKDADHADTNHAALSAGGAGRFTDYAAGHWVPQNAPAHRPAGSQNLDPAIPENPTTDAIMAEISRVWITRSDWLTCDADWAYAQAAHDWAKVRDDNQP